RISYRFQNTNENGDLIQDYMVTRIGNDYLINVHLHAIPGEAFYNDRRIWILDELIYTDFDDGRVNQTGQAEISSILNPALPPQVFTLPPDFSNASWRAYQSGSSYSATGISPKMTQTSLILEASTGRLSEFIMGSSEKTLHAETRITEIITAALDRDALEASLSVAILLGSVDRSDASMKDFIQDETYFVLRYPSTWSAKVWSSSLQQIEFTINCQDSDGCPNLIAGVFDLTENKSPQLYAQDLENSLNLQPQYRGIKSHTIVIDGQVVGIVDYLDDKIVKGELVTTKHIVYIFVGQTYRYHLDFSAPEVDFETHRDLFKVMADQFSYFKELP
ncbi:hypothetical protein KA005_17100, partial [bacterium]|nr:hypothetical protein [bacterium]